MKRGYNVRERENLPETFFCLGKGNTCARMYVCVKSETYLGREGSHVRARERFISGHRIATLPRPEKRAIIFEGRYRMRVLNPVLYCHSMSILVCVSTQTNTRTTAT